LYGTKKVWFAHSLDGSMVSKREWHTFAGIKVNDVKAIDPRSGLSLFGGPDKPGYQGLNHLFVMKMVMHQETRSLVKGTIPILCHPATP
jgi:hypothetical protein